MNVSYYLHDYIILVNLTHKPLFIPSQFAIDLEKRKDYSYRKRRAEKEEKIIEWKIKTESKVINTEERK